MTVTPTRNEYTYYDDVLRVGPHQQHDLSWSRSTTVRHPRESLHATIFLDRSIKELPEAESAIANLARNPCCLILVLRGSMTISDGQLP